MVKKLIISLSLMCFVGCEDEESRKKFNGKPRIL